MTDIRKAITKALYDLLQPVGLPVYSFVPDNEPKPFIYIGTIELQQVDNKSNFELQGTCMVELYTGSNEWTGSLDMPLTWLSAMKNTLQPYTSFVLPGTGMSYWRLFNDTGLFTFSSTKRLYNAVLQYEFELMIDGEYISNVTFVNDNVTFSGDNVTIINT